MPQIAGSFPESDAAEARLEGVVAGLGQRFSLSDLERAGDGSMVVAGLTGVRLEEVKQHLFDLEYLIESEAEVEAEAPTPALLAALSRFAEEAQAVLQPEQAGAAEPLRPDDPWAAEGGAAVPSAMALELLRRAVSFDGETVLERRPAFGERGLPVRVLHLQLKRRGLYHQDLDRPLDAFSLHGLTTLAAALRGGALADPVAAAPDAEALLPLLADIRALLARMAAQVGRTPLVYRGAVPQDADRAFADIRVTDGDFETRGGFLSGIFGFGRSWEDEGWPEYDSPEARERSLQNALALRFLQIGLWTLGFYTRRLDGIWSAGCHEALIAGLEAYDIDGEDALRPLEEGYWALNLPLIVERLFGAGDAEDDFEQQLALLEQESEGPEASLAPSENERGLWDRVRGGIRATLRFGGRVLSGVKSLLRSALDGIKRGLHWIGDKISELIGPVRNFILFVYRGAREGAQMLVRAIKPFIHFVLRKPIVTSDESGRPLAAAKFDLDRDVVFWVAPDGGGEAAEENAALCRRLARALNLILQFSGKAIRLLLQALTGPIGWTSILVSALRSLVAPSWLRFLPV